jgi:hypothetical protein
MHYQLMAVTAWSESIDWRYFDFAVFCVIERALLKGPNVLWADYNVAVLLKAVAVELCDGAAVEDWLVVANELAHLEGLVVEAERVVPGDGVEH